jgi:hypothetical protein
MPQSFCAGTLWDCLTYQGTLYCQKKWVELLLKLHDASHSNGNKNKKAGERLHWMDMARINQDWYQSIVQKNIDEAVVGIDQVTYVEFS